MINWDGVWKRFCYIYKKIEIETIYNMIVVRAAGSAVAAQAV